MPGGGCSREFPFGRAPPVTPRTSYGGTSYGDSFQLSQYQPRRRIASENSEKLVGLAM